jgi:hypothetical protein
MSETLLNLFHAYRAPMNNAAVVKGSAASVRVVRLLVLETANVTLSSVTR